MSEEIPRPPESDVTTLSDGWKVQRYRKNGSPDRVGISASLKLSRNYSSFGFERTHFTDVRPDETPEDALSRIEEPLDKALKEQGAKVQAYFNSLVANPGR